MRCPKCHGVMSGPRYITERNPFKRDESLRYTCNTCGYDDDQPCLDYGLSQPAAAPAKEGESK